MRKARLRLYQTLLSSKPALGDLGTQVLTHLLSLFWNVPRMVFYISKEENIPMFCSKSLSWSLSITSSALHGHIYLCPTFHSSPNPIGQDTRIRFCAPHCWAAPHCLSSEALSLMLSTSQKCLMETGSRAFCLLLSQQSQRLGRESAPCYSLLPSLLLFCSFLNNNNKNTKHV